ncbi:MAG: argininosuccinate lyase [Alphaproteobacteria bacterium RIFCSPLOWO2_01_FULL_40_26]|nr:MAG: argininosuccinate lyase [Alphaproteobacteria bacterium RIFCSPHIGHO2_02_FULL_40_34]OFW94222.1 MAG: argininosuccinate lyase [Alphaproteobacteria bacterium RIFCSPLOWO2_01_FULL_40_26]OFX09791.1 MAG: argininosuccinate lyase [Alphaproteobacteria bacterium RIFCSPLOWO2_02_FULL_40_19]OFX12268.1 MAG: argininosuccinate lyase [Alphaproteobacteria bacterium RIFCSPLOWO2_12_FULL_40_11]
MSKQSVSKIWGGRFDAEPSSLMQEINQSISFDYKLYKQDIRGSKAHAKMLEKVGILSASEAKKICDGLNKIEKEIVAEKFNFKIELEDIHMNIESRLKEIIGDTADKLHTARSRNDQVALDLRLFVRDEVDEILKLLKDLQKTLVKKAEENLDVIMPGFTHLQVAQPVLFSHHLLAYFEMFKRDISRLYDLRKRMNECPLGACALAGTSFPIDRKMTAKELGFDAPTANSMDSVSNRDFAIEFLFCLSLIALNLSRFAEEIVMWMSKGFKFITLSDAFTSGSSIMPQKKNPDAAELVRGKSGRIFGALFALQTTIKSLPLTYSKDMQEDKEPIFDATENSKLCLRTMAGMIADMKVNKKQMLEMAGTDYSCATDLADWLVKNLKIPFRKAHHITGSIVKMAENKELELHELKLTDLQKIEKKISKKIFDALLVENSINSRTSFGGTAQHQVKLQITAAKEFLQR